MNKVIGLFFNSVQSSRSEGKVLGYHIDFASGTRHEGVRWDTDTIQWELMIPPQIALGDPAPAIHFVRSVIYLDGALKTTTLGGEHAKQRGYANPNNPIWPFSDNGTNDQTLGPYLSFTGSPLRTPQMPLRQAAPTKLDSKKRLGHQNAPTRYVYTIVVKIPQSSLEYPLNAVHSGGYTYKEDPELYVDEC